MVNPEGKSEVDQLKADVTRLELENADLREQAEKWNMVLSNAANRLVTATGVTWQEAEQEAERNLLRR